MAINGPWIGSSALAETGQNWMSAAGSVVKVGTPFWISSLNGKSKSNATIVVGKTLDSAHGAASATYYGYNSVDRKDVAPAIGQITQNDIGLSALVVREVAGKDATWLYINNYVYRPITVVTGDGYTWNFVTTQGSNYYYCTDRTGFIAYLKARTGWTIGLQITQ